MARPRAVGRGVAPRCGGVSNTIGPLLLKAIRLGWAIGKWTQPDAAMGAKFCVGLVFKLAFGALHFPTLPKNRNPEALCRTPPATTHSHVPARRRRDAKRSQVKTLSHPGRFEGRQLCLHYTAGRPERSRNPERRANRISRQTSQSAFLRC
jgi:hypothetical protein